MILLVQKTNQFGCLAKVVGSKEEVNMKELRLVIFAGVFPGRFKGQWVFATPEEAEEKLYDFREILLNKAGIRAHFHFKLDQKLIVRIAPEGRRHEARVEITSGDQREIVLRRTKLQDNGIAISTRDGPSSPYLCADMFPEDPRLFQHPFIEQGSCCACSGNPGRAFLVLQRWTEDLFIPGKLSSLVRMAEQRINEEINRAFQSLVVSEIYEEAENAH